MTEIVVDARGQLCPKPLILTKQALKDNIVGTQIVVLIDNETSCQNVERFVRDNGMTPHIGADGSEFILRFTKHAPELAVPDAESYCVPAASASYVISLASETVGRGPAELGAILMKGLLGTLKDVDPLPSHVVLYSSGVLLAVDGSPFVDTLRDLEQRGVKLLICGTCVDYYQKKAEVNVGTISNMLSILETLTRAGKIIAP
ncbi:MAG: sulfurtransferase-like selenium metabolism protein YedF [Pseudomonadota bacterium]